ncbi:dnaJ homolog subfamily C member 2 [Lepeophtheirus salmonis]|uniref:DnaJ homolog subfamily C member 2like [Nasonia vitripennis] n=1 Tax=Lepeophtheirus salmonis TaxID=72036 RepID=A0A0K2VBY1_LEPSM|nr:dnaJ homolog subfamily C member 2-like [Lepeophtheirus salmonis]
MVSADVRTLPASFLTTIEVEPVGRWFLSQWDRIHSTRGLSKDFHESSSESESEEEETEIEFEDDIEYLRSLDPKECKDQDHYKVLGLASLRYKSTDDQIKRAYRAKVLRHHPDKRRAAGEEIRENDDYFTCITKAFDILGLPNKRRAFDSVDPEFDDTVPDWNPKRNKPEDFFKVFTSAFELNSRWSTSKKIPPIGDDDCSREKVDKFYKFWYEFDSWREFSYLDEEDKERGSDREERRWIEKNNKVQRAEKKKEEMKRIRKLVDNAYNNDPRLLRFREQDKAEKLAKKKAKHDAIKARKDEEERIRREHEEKERVEQERIEAEAKAKADAAKKEKETLKKALKKERKTLRNFCKENKFYAGEDENLRLYHMEELEKLCEMLSLNEIEGLNVALESEGTDSLGKVFRNKVLKMNNKLEKETIEMVENASSKNTSGEYSTGTGPEWSSDELALIIKAVNLFPAGTNQRWEVIASYINQHTQTPEIERKAKETLVKAKELQQGNFHMSTLKEEVNKKAYENLEKQKKQRDVKVDDYEASTRMDSAAEVQGINVNPWSQEEQALFEQALKTHPSSLGSVRWERISETLPSRSKKDCMRRYKELAEIVRAKKAAQAAAAAGKKAR